MIDSCTIVRRDPQVDGEHGRLARADPASVVLDMLCEAMNALTSGHVADDVAQLLLVLGPIVENGPAIQPDAVGLAPGLRHRAVVGEPDASEQAEQVELAFELHVLDHLVVGKIGDADLDAAGQGPELSRQCRVGGGGQRLEIVEIGRLGVRPIGSGGTAAE